MHWQFTAYAVPPMGAALVAVALAFLAWRRRPATGPAWFAALMLSTAWWSAWYAIAIMCTDLQGKLALSSIEYVGPNTVSVFWLALALAYTGRETWLTPRNVALLLVEPAFTIALTWTNQHHELIWMNPHLDTSGLFVRMDFGRGLWYWVSTAYNYTLFAIGTGLLVMALILSPGLYRRQISAMLIGAMVPFVANVLYQMEVTPPDVDLTPMAFTVTGVVTAMGLFRLRLLDIVPVARDAVIESMQDAVIVLDAHDHVVDLNPAAREIIGPDAAEAIGQPVAHVLRQWSELAGSLPDVMQASAELTVSQGDTQRHFDLRIAPLYQRRRLAGRLMVLRDITESRRAAGERERLIGDLEAYSHSVAHDLKSPLGLIMGYAELLWEDLDRLSPDEIKPDLNAIRRASRKMDNIINELLLLARVRRLEDIQVDPLDMAAIVGEARSRLSDSLAETGAEISLPDAWPVALGHAPWVEAVWVNYLSNALKYGGDPPRVVLGADPQEEGMVRFWIRDNGPGLTAEAQSQLFVPFTRLHHVEEGHGLGLSIVQRIIEKLGGEVGVESAPGEGSAFWFTLPTSQELTTHDAE